MNKNSNIKILKDHNVIEKFGTIYNNQYSNVRDNIDINTSNIDVNVNSNTGYRFTRCTELPTPELRRLCQYRSNNDATYANWISTGRAWWFNCYPSNRRIEMGFGWESDPIRYPLPTWWWRYPEIPAPSIEWLSQNFQTNGETVRRRNYYLPKAGTNIFRRVDLRNNNSNCNNIINDNIEEIDININELMNPNGQFVINESVTTTDINSTTYNPNYLYNNNNIGGVQDYPVNTREGFDSMAVGGINQSYCILSLIIIVLLVIFLFIYNRH